MGQAAYEKVYPYLSIYCDPKPVLNSLIKSTQKTQLAICFLFQTKKSLNF